MKNGWCMLKLLVGFILYLFLTQVTFATDLNNQLESASSSSNNAATVISTQDASSTAKNEQENLKKSTKVAPLPIYSDNSKPITVSPQNAVFLITLPINTASTGYTWITKSYDKKILELKSQKYHPSITRLLGAPGTEQWQFVVRSDAFKQDFKTTIELICARQWELPKEKIAKKINFEVVYARR